MNKEIYYLDIASEFMTQEEIRELNEKYSTLLKGNNIFRCSPDQIQNKESLIFFILSGGVEGRVLKLIEQHRKHFQKIPIVLLTHPYDNSLPAALELLARLKQDSIEGRIFQLISDNDIKTIKELRKYLSRLDPDKPLAGKKIGMIGQPSDWLIASSPAASIVKERWGADIVDIDLNDLIQRITQSDSDSVKSIADQFRQQAVEILEPDNDDLIEAVKVYISLKEIIEEYKLDAISLRCFDIVKELNTTGCFALAKLNEESICASCEGDIVSLLGMIWIRQVTGKIPWMANPSLIDATHGEMLLAHCTIAFDLVEEYTIRTHFESGIGVGIQGKIPLEPVTLVRFGGSGLDKIWITEGTITEIPESENLCRTQVKISFEDKYKLSELLNSPLGNHLLLIKGNYAKILLNNWNIISN